MQCPFTKSSVFTRPEVRSAEATALVFPTPEGREALDSSEVGCRRFPTMRVTSKWYVYSGRSF